jgi:hypothetical protein
MVWGRERMEVGGGRNGTGAEEESGLGEGNMGRRQNGMGAEMGKDQFEKI